MNQENYKPYFHFKIQSKFKRKIKENSSTNYAYRMDEKTNENPTNPHSSAPHPQLTDYSKTCQLKVDTSE